MYQSSRFNDKNTFSGNLKIHFFHISVVRHVSTGLRAYSPLLGCAGDWVEMVVKVHYGTVLKGRICRHVKYTSPKIVLQCTLTTSRPGIPRNLKLANIGQLSVSAPKAI